MKQTILKQDAAYVLPSSGPCYGRLLLNFAVYGWAIWWLDRSAGGAPLAQALVWSVAVLGGSALAFLTWGA